MREMSIVENSDEQSLNDRDMSKNDPDFGNAEADYWEQGRQYLRSQWKFASFQQFIHTFADTLKLADLFYDLTDMVDSDSKSRKKKRNIDQTAVIIDTEDLENAIMSTTENELLIRIHVNLMKKLTLNHSITKENWDLYFRKLFTERMVDFAPLVYDAPLYQANPALSSDIKEDSGSDSQCISIKSENTSFYYVLQTFSDYWTEVDYKLRLEALYMLCESSLVEIDKFRMYLKDSEEHKYWRIDPIGYDSEGSAYYLFDDNRLYKMKLTPIEKAFDVAEDETENEMPRRSSRKRSKKMGWKSVKKSKKRNPTPPPVSMKETWHLVCSANTEEWSQVAEQFSSSKDKNETAFYKFLSRDLVPQVLSAIEENQATRKKQITRKQRYLQNQYLESSRSSSADSFFDEMEDLGIRRSTRLRRKIVSKNEASDYITGDQLDEYMGFSDIKRPKSPDDDSDYDDYDSDENFYCRKRGSRRGLRSQNEIEKPSYFSPGGTKLSDREVRLLKRQQKLVEEKINEAYNQRPKPDHWFFDCPCGIRELDYDDGETMILCEECNIWMHMGCVDIPESNNTDENFKFICDRCTKVRSLANDPDSSNSNSTARSSEISDVEDSFDTESQITPSESSDIDVESFQEGEAHSARVSEQDSPVPKIKLLLNSDKQ